MKKRVLAAVLLAISAMCLMTGCKKKTECDSCGDKTYCEKVTYDGESAYLCDDCEDLFNAIMDQGGF